LIITTASNPDHLVWFLLTLLSQHYVRQRLAIGICLKTTQ